MKTLLIVLIVLLLLPLILNLSAAFIYYTFCNVLLALIHHPFITLGVIGVLILLLKK